MPYKKIPVPVPPGKKYCFQCSSVKDHSEFYKRAAANDGLDPACKPCRREQRVRSKNIRAALEEAYENTNRPMPPNPDYKPEPFEARGYGFTYNPYRDAFIRKAEEEDERARRKAARRGARSG